ncbi:MAG TPA: YraN family protein [Ktedonobacterales bacterium]|jgi:putative endonuclease|nr:YraN family protein [Ktedonobacterales bacterium]
MSDDASGKGQRTKAATPRMRLGASGERLAAGWLEARGYTIVATNWHCAYGEADLIAERAGELIFVEVKTRRGDALGAPEEAVTAAKQRKLIATTQTYLMENGIEDRAFRIDVIAVQLTPAGRLVEIRHYPAAVALED